MDAEIVKTIITGVFGLVTGAILAYLGAILKFRKDLEAEYDKDLRNKRIDAYKELWSDLEILARYDRPKPLNRKTLAALTVAMRKWYFQVGGLFLSDEARQSYFELKDFIQDLLNNARFHGEESLGADENAPDLELILQKASLLRARLTKDVGTRKSSPIADS